MAMGVSHMDGRMENHNVPIVPNKIPGTPSINGNMSGITDELGSPKVPTMSFTSTKIRLTPIPEQNHNLFVNEKLNDEGYDSNDELGLTRNAPVMEEDINIDEEVVAQILVANKKIESHGELFHLPMP